jgi:hypothetical protein
MIMKKIRDQFLPQITTRQLNNLKSALHNKAVKSKSGLNELIEWCENHSEIPENDDDVFVGDYDYELGNLLLLFLLLLITVFY